MDDQDHDVETIITKTKQKPFKLCFTPKILVGKSRIYPGKSTELAKLVTTKVYTDSSAKCEFTEAELKPYLDKLTIKYPREIYEKPITENQKYGWYNDFAVRMIDDGRLNFAKRCNQMIIEHLMNYTKIR